MYLICGLGNPGRDYEATRHNMGFITVDRLSEKLGIKVNKLKFRALIGEGSVCGEKLILMKPQTYMNLSGEAIREAAAFYKIEPANILVIYDDSDIEVGSIRIRPFGSAGSHNGMKSVVFQLGTDRFPRIRIGIGSRGPIPMEKFVLGKWTDEERPLLADAVDAACSAATEFLNSGIDSAMNKYNKKAQ